MLKNAFGKRCYCMVLVRVSSIKISHYDSNIRNEYRSAQAEERLQALSHTNTVHTLIRKMSSEHLHSVKNELTRLTGLHCWKPVRPTLRPQIHHTNTISDRVICIRFMKQDLCAGKEKGIYGIISVKKARRGDNNELIQSKRSPSFRSNIFCIHDRPENGTILPEKSFHLVVIIVPREDKRFSRIKATLFSNSRSLDRT